MESISFTKAVSDFEALMDRVVTNRVQIAIENAEGEGVVLISARDWAQIENSLLYPALSR